MDLLKRSIKKKDIADFCQKMSLLLDAGYDVCSAAEVLAMKPSGKQKDHSADGLREVATILLPELKEGFPLYEAMKAHKKHFGVYINQIEVGEKAGKTGEVLLRISEQIRNASNIMNKLKGAMAYPVFVLIFTLSVAFYLFTNVIPDMLGMLADVGAKETPATTKLVIAFGEWTKAHGFSLFIILAIIIICLVVYSKTIGKKTMAKFYTKIPLLGKVIINNAMTTFFKNWQQMILAGAEMSVSLQSAAQSIPNLYLQEVMLHVSMDYAQNGVQVHEALRNAPCIRELESKTVQVSMEGENLARVLGILAADREYEANRSVNAVTAALNPILLILVGIVVGILVLSIYEPIMSVSSAIQ